MANSTKGAGNFLGPLFIVAVVVVGGLVLTFALTGEEAPDEPTIIAEEGVDERPAGAGTVPEGNADPEMEGITDEIDEVDPASPTEDSVPAAEQGAGETQEDASSEPASDEAASDEGGDSASDDTEPTAVPVAEDTGSEGDAARLVTPETGPEESDSETSREDSFLIEEGSGDGQPGDDADSVEGASVPEGRDAQTELNPDSEDDVVEDTDSGGTAFVPTPSGPEGGDDSAVTAQ